MTVFTLKQPSARFRNSLSSKSRVERECGVVRCDEGSKDQVTASARCGRGTACCAVKQRSATLLAVVVLFLLLLVVVVVVVVVGGIGGIGGGVGNRSYIVSLPVHAFVLHDLLWHVRVVQDGHRHLQ